MWVETTSPNFSARHELVDEDDVASVLELLEDTRDRLGAAFALLPRDVAVVVHGSPLALALAQPYVPLIQRLTAPAARRYLAGWATTRELHLLAPRLLEGRASSVPGSREMALLAPAALYSQLVAATNSRLLPPPWRPLRIARSLRWSWLSFGAGQYFSGQTAFARPAISRRLREGSEPAFPPGLRDSLLLGGTILDLLAREHGEDAAVKLVTTDHRRGPQAALEQAFGRDGVHTGGVWRAHLAAISGAP